LTIADIKLDKVGLATLIDDLFNDPIGLFFTGTAMNRDRKTIFC
jgi:hypothetical protein